MLGDLALLVIRVTTGALLAGHGAQKLFGWFGGHGPKGTAGFMEMLGLRPGQPWALAAGASEFFGGALTALGLFNPLGPIGILSAMSMAGLTAHRGKPIWATAGGGELPLTNAGVATALLIAGPGRFSLDKLLGIRLPWGVGFVALLAAAAGVGVGLSKHSAHLAQPAPPPRAEEEPAQPPAAAQPSAREEESLQARQVSGSTTSVAAR